MKPDLQSTCVSAFSQHHVSFLEDASRQPTEHGHCRAVAVLCDSFFLNPRIISMTDEHSLPWPQGRGDCSSLQLPALHYNWTALHCTALNLFNALCCTALSAELPCSPTTLPCLYISSAKVSLPSSPTTRCAPSVTTSKMSTRSTDEVVMFHLLMTAHKCG